MKVNKSLIALIVSMTVFGTVGIFSKQIPLPSGAIALSRAIIGMISLLIFSLAAKRRYDFEKIKKNLKLLVFSGIALGMNWMLFFLACRTTSVPTATLSYYLAPTFIVLLSFIIFGERLNKKQAVCVLLSLFGMVLASGVTTGVTDGVSLMGIAYGACAAALYATVVILNKKMGDIDPIDKTTVQFLIAGVSLVPYVLASSDLTLDALSFDGVIYLLLIGILHTGVCYVLYFGCVSRLKASTVAVYSYIDPVVSIIVSTLIFSEPIDAFVLVGAVMILGSSSISEIDFSCLKSHKSKQ